MGKETVGGSAIARPRTHLYIVLDESISMEDVQRQTIAAVNEFVRTQQRKRVDELFATLLKFNSRDRLKFIYESKPVAEVPLLTTKTYTPDGNTALRDAIGATIAHGDKHTGAGDRVLVAVVTDGEDTDSHRVRSDQQLKTLVQARIARGNWTFILLGANISARDVAADYGFGAGNAKEFNVADIGTAMATVANALVSYRQRDDLQTGTFHNPPKQWSRPQWAAEPAIVLTDDK